MSTSIFSAENLVSQSPDPAPRRGQPVTLLEIDWFSGSIEPQTIFNTYLAGPHLSAPHLTSSLTSPSEDITDTLKVSDVGYVTRQNDSPANVYYPPYLRDSISVDRRVNIEPWQNGAGASWGSAEIARGDGRFDNIVNTGSPDGRPLSIKTGYSLFENSRQINVHPSYSTLSETFRGVSGGLWRSGEDNIFVDIRDATYLLERPIQTSTYEGTGGYEGTEELRGVTKPMTRGGGSTTNLVLQSEFASGWSTSVQGAGITSTLTPNFGTAPNGTTTAARLVLDIGTGNLTTDVAAVVSTSITGQTNPHTHTVSVWIKSNDSNIYSVRVRSQSGAAEVCIADSQWRRYSATGIRSATTNHVSVELRGDSTASKNADILIWGAQFEIRDYASLYVPTTSSAVTVTYPVLNVSPVLIDPVNRIYQYNDAPGRVTEVYERGAAVFTFQGDTTNLYASTTNSGQYRTDNSRGLFQLGATPVGEITADVIGEFLSAGLKSNPADIALGILEETYSLPSTEVDRPSFESVRSQRPWFAGFYLTGRDTGAVVLGDLMRSVGAWVTPSKTGKISTKIQDVPENIASSAQYNASQIVSCQSARLPETLSPPPYRIRVGHSRRYTVQQDISVSATDARRQLISEEWTFATWLKNENLTLFRLANDPPEVRTYLLNATEASLLAESFGTIFGVRRSLWDITLPASYAFKHEIGDSVNISFPNPNLQGNPFATVVGDRYRFSENACVYTVMV